MKINVKPSTDLAPVSVVMVSCGDMEASDIVTIAWTGTVNSEPPMLSISVRPSRYSYELIRKTGEFVVNLVTKELLPVCDGCGRSVGAIGGQIREVFFDERGERKSARSPDRGKSRCFGMCREKYGRTGDARHVCCGDRQCRGFRKMCIR